MSGICRSGGAVTVALLAGLAASTAFAAEGGSNDQAPAVEQAAVQALEAMSAEVPVVSSNAGGLPEVVEHGFTGFLHDPTDVDGYVESALKLLTNETLRRAMGRRGRRIAKERFTAEEMVQKYVQVYESLR